MAPNHQEKSPMTDEIDGDVFQFLDDKGAELVGQYFSPAYTGSQFHLLGGGGDSPTTRDSFDATDIVAVKLLGVDISAEASLQILQSAARRLNALLKEIPNDASIESAPRELFEAGSPASLLWYELDAISDIAWVTANKLMARKRPHLFPVYDNVVKAAIQPNRDAFWIPLWNELKNPELITKLSKIRNDNNLPKQLPLIRILDAAIWMRNHKASKDKLPFKPRLT